MSEAEEPTEEVAEESTGNDEKGDDAAKETEDATGKKEEESESPEKKDSEEDDKENEDKSGEESGKESGEESGEESEEEEGPGELVEDYEGFVVSDYAKKMHRLMSEVNARLRHPKMDVEFIDTNKPMPTYTSYEEFMANYKPEFVVERASRVEKVRVWIADTTDVKWTMEEGLQNPSDFNVLVLIIDKTKPVNAFAQVALSVAAENCTLTLVFKPEDKEKIKPTLTTLFNRPEWLNLSMWYHLILFPRLQICQVSFSEAEVKKYKKVVTCVAVGKETIALSESASAIIAKDMNSVLTYRSRVHHFCGNGMEEGVLLEKCEKKLDTVPKFDNVLHCQDNDSNFYLTISNFFEGLTFAEKNPDVELELAEDIPYMIEDMMAEYSQYNGVGDDEEEEEDESQEQASSPEGEEEEKEKKDDKPEPESEPEPEPAETKKKTESSAAPKKNRKKSVVRKKTSANEEKRKAKSYLHHPNKFTTDKKPTISKMSLHDVHLSNVVREFALPKRYLTKTGSAKCSVIFVIGDLDEVLSNGTAEQIDMVESQLHLGVARAAAKSDAIIVDSGLPTSVGALVSEVKALPVFALGVSFTDSVDESMLDPRYARIAYLTSSEESEFEAKKSLTERLTDGCNIVCLLCGGTKDEHASELSSALNSGWAVLALEDTGGFAAEVAQDINSYKIDGGGKLVSVPKRTTPSDIASCMHICMMISL